MYLPLDNWQAAKRMLEGKKVIIHGDGTTLWTLTHNTDFAQGFVGLMGNVHAIGDTFHITSDERLSWNQIYEIVADARALN
jgi:nucleoside-diphosphate-sugar epimerase